MEEVSRKQRIPAKTQHRLSLFIFGLLAVIAGSLFWIQGRYDPASWRARPEGPAPLAGPETDLSEGLVPMSAPEHYNAQTLSDKIDGKADLYLSAGFNSLECRRYRLDAGDSQWLEQYVYHMAGHPNAFAVFSAQRRKQIQHSNLAAYAYQSANGLFLVHGPFYVEIIASEDTARLQAQMANLAAAFVRSHTVTPQNLFEIALFPAQHRVPDTTVLIADSAFGIQSLNWIYTAAYAADGDSATAFLSKRPSPDQSRALAETFMAYWKEYGAETVAPPASFEGAGIAFILDNYEIVAVQGNYLLGVHEATRLDLGLALVEGLKRAVEGADR